MGWFNDCAMAVLRAARNKIYGEIRYLTAMPDLTQL